MFCLLNNKPNIHKSEANYCFIGHSSDLTMTDYRLTIESSVTNDATNNGCADLVCNYNKLMIYKSNGCLLAAHCSDNMH